MNLISRSRATNICANFNNLRLLVVGDLMLDHWVWGDVSRICPEAPVPVVNVRNSSYTLGGAANVAANIRALGAKVDMLGVVGTDDAGRRLRDLLSSLDIGIEGICLQDDIPTSLKSRIIANNQQVVRVDIELRCAPKESAFRHIVKYIEDKQDLYDAIVFSDYNKGLLWQGMGDKLVASVHKVPVIAGPKPDNIACFANIDTITLNASEGSQATKCDTGSSCGLLNAGEYLLQSLKCQNAIITLGARGMALFRPDSKCVKVPALASQVYDVSGAGDTVLSVVALCRALNIDCDEAVCLASQAAAIVVRKVGTATVTPEELLASLDSEPRANILAPERKILSLTDACDRINRLRQEPTPKSIVFTNGCFDILHAGHLRTLLTAKREGDFLVVGLNSDASVRRLKGEQRPINSQEERAQMLAALECVDLVVIFDEDTPLKVIETLQPDVHVKGGDYKEDDLPEAETIKSYGGKLVLAKLLPGHSTTNIIVKSKDLQ